MMTIDERIEKLQEEMPKGFGPALKALIESDYITNAISKSLAESFAGLLTGNTDFKSLYYTLTLAWFVGYDQAKSEQMEKEFAE